MKEIIIAGKETLKDVQGTPAGQWIEESIQFLQDERGKTTRGSIMVSLEREQEQLKNFEELMKVTS